jgi:4-hydroxy-tetrahydrodipicolinate synthase
MGKASDEVRLPLAPMSDANRAKLTAIIKEYGLI